MLNSQIAHITPTGNIPEASELETFQHTMLSHIICMDCPNTSSSKPDIHHLHHKQVVKNAEHRKCQTTCWGVDG